MITDQANIGLQIATIELLGFLRSRDHHSGAFYCSRQML